MMFANYDFVVFAAAEDDIEEVATNQRMFQNVINAHTLASPDLQFVVFPGGTRVRCMRFSFWIWIAKQPGIWHLCFRRHTHTSLD